MSNDNNSNKPEWIRPSEVKSIFGISRSKAYELMNEGVVKSISLKKRGQANGTRLISYDSIANYFNKLAEEQKEGLV